MSSVNKFAFLHVVKCSGLTVQFTLLYQLDHLPRFTLVPNRDMSRVYVISSSNGRTGLVSD